MSDATNNPPADQPEATGTHTPGPWTVDASTVCPVIRASGIGSGAYYSSVAVAIQRDAHPFHRGGIDASTADANARLIAAAPDLLEALIRLAPILDNDGHLAAAYRDVEPLVRAALAKANGGAL